MVLLAAVDGKFPGKAPLQHCFTPYTFKCAKHHLFRDSHETPRIVMLDTVLEWHVKSCRCSMKLSGKNKYHGSRQVKRNLSANCDAPPLKEFSKEKVMDIK